MNVAVSIRIAGEGPLRSELEKQAKNLGVSNEIKFDGVVQDIPTFLSRAKFLVHTSESEGCPNVIMEAMAAGIPVVAMAAGDIPYLVEEGKTGFVVRPGDNHGLASRIATLLNDQNLCRQMGERARKRAEQEFELHSLVTRTVNAYKAAGWREE
jgi:glycosyltransferase involved in cell wall biosynthesis